jgi:uncharacterized membrane protein YdcZ (DUF606 family)
MRRYVRKLLISLAPLAIGAAIGAAAKIDPTLTENLYSLGIYTWIAGFLGAVNSTVPFSLAELLLAGSVIFAATLCAYVIFGLVRKSFRRQGFTKNTIFFALFAASCVFLAFHVLCAPNYHRYSFAEYAGLEVRPSSTEELAALCESLIERSNALRAEISTDANGVMRLSDASATGAMRAARAAFDQSALRFPVLSVSRTVPKPVTGSVVLSHLNLSGFFFPYTGEANVNVHMPDSAIPFTACHELAHTAGFMREDEANFIGYLACTMSDRADIRYSGTLQALIYCTNALYAADPALYREVASAYGDGVLTDLRFQSAYWKRYEGKAAQLSEAVNDAYLKLNDQQDGTQSYGRMVDLMLAYYRSTLG